MNHPLIIVLALGVVLAIGGALAWFVLAGRVDTEPAQLARTRIQDIPKEYWAELARQRIFFGHQSVGYNLVAGIQDLMKEHPEIQLNLMETTHATAFDQPAFAHGRVGRNTDPASKIDAFRVILESGVGAKVNIAFFKFCYVDIEAGTDVTKLHEQYGTALEALSRRFPEARFLHLTAPLVSVRPASVTSPRQFLKVVLRHGRALEGNRKRGQFNSLLTASPTKAAFFDLAFWETINPREERTFRNRDGERVYLLSPELTYDGGHLNEQGRKTVAEQLLVTLANLAHERVTQSPRR